MITRKAYAYINLLTSVDMWWGVYKDKPSGYQDMGMHAKNTGLIQVFLKHWDPTYEEIQKDESNTDFEEASIEDQAYEQQEHVDEKTINPPFHQSTKAKGLVKNGSLQISESDRTFVEDFMEDIYVEELLEHDKFSDLSSSSYIDE